MTRELIVTVNNNSVGGWHEFMLERSLDLGDMLLELAVKRDWRNDKSLRLQKGDPVQAYLDDELLLTGYIADRFSEYDDRTHTLRIAARSKVGDLIDSTLVGKTFVQAGLVQIALTLCKPFNIGVIDTVGVNEKFRTEQVLNDGESPWAFLEELARIRGVRLMPTVDGDLMIVRAGTYRSETPLVLGDNIVNSRGTQSEREEFSEYRVVANQAADDALFGASDTALIEGVVKNSGIRYRPTTIIAYNPMTSAECRSRANWQLRTHAGRANSTVYSVKGLTQNNGQTWQPNSLVPVMDPYAQIESDMLIVSARMQRAKGDSTELTVMPPAAYELQASKEAASTSAGLFS